MGNYSAARAVLGVLSFIGWAIAVLGPIAGFSAAGQRASSGVALAIAVSGIVAGLVIVAVVQIARAQIDTAINTSEACTLLRKMLDRPVSASAPAPAGPAASGPEHILKRYKGVPICKVAGGYQANGEIYSNMLEAEKGVDRDLDRP